MFLFFLTRLLDFGREREREMGEREENITYMFFWKRKYNLYNQLKFNNNGIIHECKTIYFGQNECMTMYFLKKKNMSFYFYVFCCVFV